MNIGIVTTWFERGAAYVSRSYMDVLSANNSVFIYARGGEKYAQGDPKWDLPNVTWGKKKKNRIVTWIEPADLWKFIEKNQIDCLLFNEQHSWEILLELKRKRPSLSIGAYIDYYKPETVPFFAIYDFLLCNTNRHFSVFDWHPGALYIPWGTDLQLFHPTPRTRDTLTFFHSCGMDPKRKGTARVARAWAQLQGESHLLIHSQIPLNDEIQLLAQKNPGRLELVVGDVTAPGLYSRGDVYVYPTILEGVGLTISEALASGLPVITTDNGPMNEWVQEGISGKLVAVERFQTREDNYYWPESYPDENSLREAMQWYVDHPPIGPHQTKAREFAEQHLNWKENAFVLNDFLLSKRDKGTKPSAELVKNSTTFEKVYSRMIMLHNLKVARAKLGVGKLKRFLCSRGGATPSSEVES